MVWDGWGISSGNGKWYVRPKLMIRPSRCRKVPGGIALVLVLSSLACASSVRDLGRSLLDVSPNRGEAQNRCTITYSLAFKRFITYLMFALKTICSYQDIDETAVRLVLSALKARRQTSNRMLA